MHLSRPEDTIYRIRDLIHLVVQLHQQLLILSYKKCNQSLQILTFTGYFRIAVSPDQLAKDTRLTSIVPNTLDTAIRWQGYAANNSNEELAFIITGDMYVLDTRSPSKSANKLQKRHVVA